MPDLEVQLMKLGDDKEEAAVVGFTEQDKDRGDQSLSRGEKVVD